jgi:hypothetical protein
MADDKFYCIVCFEMYTYLAGKFKDKMTYTVYSNIKE